jgi:peroxiredoxin
MALFRKNKQGTGPLRSGEKAPNFELPSVQGGLFRLDMRTAHGPVVLAFVDAGEESRDLLEELKKHEADFQRVGADNYPYSKLKARANRKPYSTIGPTVAATVAAIVRAKTMGPVRELQKRLKLPYYVLWDETSQVSRKYGVPEEEDATAVVEPDGTLTWFPEPVESRRVEQILQAVLSEQEEDPGSES